MPVGWLDPWSRPRWTTLPSFWISRRSGFTIEAARLIGRQTSVLGWHAMTTSSGASEMSWMGASKL
ncbi:hypothetical protein KSP40_PGU014700 [Platanthera guangdongensis]|uniref:Uncharacterized protein n=1 Tax=Platanthera guangdongensis TaxID=2320717 RepID=A0ABR2MYE8_9ASPA